jgi:DNA-binding NarL/FixJ family response regulator
MNKIRVLLADDHTVVRRGIRNMLEQEPDIDVVGEAGDGEEALQLTEVLAPDVLLLDVEMPGLSGVEVTRRLHARKSPVKILALSAYDDRQYTLGLLANGAAGYLTKEEDPRTIVAAVRGVGRGEEGWLSRRVALQVVAWAQDESLTARALTEQELRLLQRVVSGKTNPEIAAALGVSERDVEERLGGILTKLGGTSRTKAAMQAVREGLVEGALSIIRVLIVEEIQLMCHMLAALLEDESDVEVVGCATTVKEALGQIQNCDMILVNSALPDQGALTLSRAVTRLDPAVKVLVVGLSEVEPAVLEYIEAGAAGFVLREDSTEALLKHIRSAHRDAALISPRIAAALMSRINELANWVPEQEQQRSNLEELTPRERQVLFLVGQGLSNKEIAEQLYIQPGTVKNHVHNIFKKLNVNSRQDAAAFVPLVDRQQP